ncbi:unnamed protein product [Vitrella brassicaformis CCMP3155]|uniref:Uncharacterized protein n=1 Tax=Vitrella brassicaformis (strain CCMP3155) TaxID=1169540 RepID=A0A0G4EWW6_VITBC|nr:unnamed protein product [Vitrella brassicaformis CCMP3155]|eukprot:CEM02764.1 unnamed protein product [Vitrella brassicaformis CCMP3155]
MSVADASRGFLQRRTAVPDVLLGCHAPTHGLKRDAELPFLFQESVPPSEWTLDAVMGSFAFIDYERGVELPRSFSGYRNNEEVVEFETADHHIVEEARDWDISRYGAGYHPFPWSKLAKSPIKPHYWQLDLTDTQQLYSAHSSLGLPLNHFKTIVLVYCPQTIFWNIFVNRNVTLSEVQKKVLPQWNIITSFWQNIKSLLAPGGILIVNNVPGFFKGKACSCGAQLENTMCLQGQGICWDEDSKGKFELFKYFIKLTEEAGLRLTQAVYFNIYGKMGVRLQRVN